MLKLGDFFSNDLNRMGVLIDHRFEKIRKLPDAGSDFVHMGLKGSKGGFPKKPSDCQHRKKGISNPRKQQFFILEGELSISPFRKRSEDKPSDSNPGEFQDIEF